MSCGRTRGLSPLFLRIDSLHLKWKRYISKTNQKKKKIDITYMYWQNKRALLEWQKEIVTTADEGN
ncbi:hypothetical protein MiTs_00371 [Microcystis aeruginosa NIES-2521]|uniref:Uncharacterized protein n=1 Tax=Microcystis aeruginosa NIES-2521 TaxID=2303983 RepID=A0A5A5RP76_MICAE|nr:hypothetical protein MiTs_00371 [Microcystis aeruginosa NIES-2521]